MPRVTNEELRDLIAGVDDGVVGLKTGLATLVERCRNMETQLQKLNGSVGKLDDLVDANAKDIGKLQERQGVLAGVNTVFTTIAALLAAWFGANR